MPKSFQYTNKSDYNLSMLKLSATITHNEFKCITAIAMMMLVHYYKYTCTYSELMRDTYRTVNRVISKQGSYIYIVTS